MDRIILKNMKFYGYHGVLPEEQSVGQYFHIDVEMYVDLAEPGSTDRLEDTVDYSAVYADVKAIAENNKFRLIEKLADSISREILSKYDRLSEIKVRVRKPSAPIEGEFDWMEVETHRSRNGK